MIVFLAAPMSMQLHLQDLRLASCGVGLDMGIDMCYSRVIYISRVFLLFFSSSPLFFLLSLFYFFYFKKKTLYEKPNDQIYLSISKLAICLNLFWCFSCLKLGFDILGACFCGLCCYFTYFLVLPICQKFCLIVSLIVSLIALSRLKDFPI